MRKWSMTGKQLEFSSFYAAAKDDCLRSVLVTVADRELAEDLVAEAFTRAWASWRTVRAHPAPRAWVVRTALNLHVSWWRRRRRETGLDDRDPAAPQDGGGPDGELLAAVRQLPVRQQQVIILRLLFDLDAQATARELGIAPGTVGVHLHRALAALRARIPAPASQEAAE